ncbi:AsmA family protein [Lacinutrix jangbogonensis]|uniref:DUF748 domain-containing protein n=1 Tax=Lacinutrix jangbogonensis TaxID=1469557 RepID=UPI00053D39FB|nr:DUF748 domain-containing protein [Lacinutrix jangbogonensis]
MKKTIIRVLIVLVLIAIANKGLRFWIKSNFNARINSNLERAYNITYSELDLDVLFNGITLNKVNIEPINHKKGTIIRGHVDYASLNGLVLKDLLFNKRLNIDEITFKQPKFEVTLSADTIQKTSGKGLQSMFGDILSRANINNFRIENGSIVLIDPISKAVKGQIKKLNIVASEIETDSLKFKYLIPFEMRDLEVTLDSISFELNAYTHFGLGRFQYKLRDKEILLNDISLGYSTDWVDVSRRLGVQKDIIELNVKEIGIHQFEPSNNFYTQLDIVAQKISVDELNIKLQRNKNIPKPPDTTKSSFDGIINSIPTKILIDSLQISNSSLMYRELGVKKRESGSINLQNINGTITGITNMSEQQNNIGEIDANIKASLLGKAGINIALNIPYDRPEVFSLDLDVGEMEMKNLNTTLKPLIGMEIVSGQMKQIQYHMNAGRNQSSNRLVFDYDNLHLKLINENNKGKKNTYYRPLLTVPFEEIIYLIKKNTLLPNINLKETNIAHL